MKDGRYEVRLAGAGGQGVALAARILAEAALRCGRHAANSQAYGPASRGGASRSDVIVAAEAIDYPLVRSLDVLVALTGEALRTYLPDLGAGGLLVVDRDAVEAPPEGPWSTRIVPIVATAMSVAGTTVASGVAALGALEALTEAVATQALATALADGVPAGRVEVNQRVFAAARALAAASAEQGPDGSRGSIPELRRHREPRPEAASDQPRSEARPGQPRPARTVRVVVGK